LKVVISPSQMRGRVEAPPSKSVTHRMVTLAALAEGTTTIRNPLASDDTLATLNAVNMLGANTEKGEDQWAVEGGSLKAPAKAVHCGESGTTIRFMTAVCGLVDGSVRLTAGPSLSRRPMGPLLDALNSLGVEAQGENGHPPITVNGRGGIGGGEAALPGDVSSQFVSALLLVAPLMRSPLTVRVTTPLQSWPYVQMTMDAMHVFGVKAEASPGRDEFTAPTAKYRASEVNVEGDWSSASILLAAGALGGEVTVGNLDRESSQADTAILDILSSMGAEYFVNDNDVTSKKSRLKAMNHDFSDHPDLFPVSAALCSAAEGTSTLTGLERLRLKESDRVASMTEGLKRMGVKVATEDDMVSINGGTVRGAEVNPHNDHRIAMSLAVLALAAEGDTTIRDAGCVTKSYPGFWGHLEHLGARIRRRHDE
jgi:3-phosphoshikimate 1-carboxyvinyltransferase